MTSEHLNQQDITALRRQLRQSRAALSAEALYEAATRLEKNLLSFLQTQGNFAHVAGYLAVKGEIDVAPTLASLRANGASTYLPVIHDAGPDSSQDHGCLGNQPPIDGCLENRANDGCLGNRPPIDGCLGNRPNDGCLKFARFDEQSRFVVGRFGIQVPEHQAQALLSAAALEVVLVPLVAFDPLGNRLGMGGGFYDRTFSFCHPKNRTGNSRLPLLIGVAHELQCIDKLVSQPWDVPMNAIVTDKQIYQTEGA